MPSRSQRWIYVALFVGITLAHAFSEYKGATDSKWALHKAYSLYTEGNTDLFEWRQEAEKDTMRIRWIDGKPYSIFPDGAALSAVPIVALIDIAMRAATDRNYKDELDLWRIGDVQELWASMLIAFAALLLFQAAIALGASTPGALAIGLILAFASPAYSTGTRALWSHSPALLVNAAILWQFARAWSRGERPNWLLLGILAGLGVVARPTSALVAVGVLLVGWSEGRAHAMRVLLGGGIVAVLFCAFNLWNYGSILPAYYSPTRVGDLATLWKAAPGNLFSPSRGLLIFVPWLPFALVGLRALHARRPVAASILAAVLLAHWLIVSTFGHWWAGHSYGPRFFTEQMPFFALGLLPYFARGQQAPRGRAIRLGLGTTVLVALAIHGIGANLAAVHHWNVDPNDIDQHPERIWDFRDPQFLHWSD